MQKYDSMRGWFAYELYSKMKENKDVWLIVGDLGYGMFDEIKKDFPERFINTGAAEQAMVGIAVGLAEMGKIPFVYTATPFLLYRPFETIRNYINAEKVPVKLVGSGRETDYLSDGKSHWVVDDHMIEDIFPNIKSLWPDKKEDIPRIVEEMINTKRPYYLNLRR